MRKMSHLEVDYKGQKVCVSWAQGHPCELKQAGDYNPDYNQWSKLPVPFVPERFELKVPQNSEYRIRISRAIIDEAERAETEDERVQIENVIREAFGDKEQAKNDFLEMTKESGLSVDVKLGKSLVRKQFGTQKFKADNGIELKFPTELLEQPEALSFITNPDGSVTITMRNLRSADA